MKSIIKARFNSVAALINDNTFALQSKVFKKIGAEASSSMRSFNAIDAGREQEIRKKWLEGKTGLA